jgi:hypothetical protein
MNIANAKKMKYIIVNEGLAILFGEALKHSDVARGFRVESAGFVYIGYDAYDERFVSSPFGESVSLGIKSNPESDKIKIDFILND